MVLDLTTLVNFGFPEILLWLLTFAVIYGVLSHAGEKGMPKSQASRAIIAIVSGFFVLFAAPLELISVLTNMSSSLILVVVGLLVMIVFLEVAGVKATKKAPAKDKEGNIIGEIDVAVGILEKYSKEFGIILILITVVIFIASGGLDLLGLQNLQITGQAVSSIVFFGIILVAIIWMINAK